MAEKLRLWEKVKAVSEAARFPSREAPEPAPEPLMRKPRYHKTGRTTQFNTRIMPATHAKVDKTCHESDEEDPPKDVLDA